MASKQTNVDFVLEQMAEAGPVSARKMFGEYGIYCGDKIVALFCDDQLFIKPTDAGRAFIGAVTEGAPYPGAKPWLLIGGDHCEDGEWLSELVRITFRVLPAAEPKPAKKQEKGRPTAKARTKPALSKSSGAKSAKSAKQTNRAKVTRAPLEKKPAR